MVGFLSDKASVRFGKQGMTLVEILLVVTVIAVLASLFVPYFSPIRGAASEQIARQQQAELQTALANWLIAYSSSQGGLAAARSAYNGSGDAKLQLLQNYIQTATYASLTGSGNTVSSAALDGANAYLQFSDWPSVGQPTVEWINR